jgi:hypothetical protein
MKERDAVLLCLGGAVLVWLIFREGSSGASQQAALSLPTVQIPGVQNYSVNVPASRNWGLANYVPPASLVYRSGRDQGRRSATDPSAAAPTCGCQGGATSSLFTSVNQMLSTFANEVEGLQQTYTANILSAVEYAGGQ